MQLRYYQQDAIDALYKYLGEKPGNPCIVMPTGSGKTPVLTTICNNVACWDGRVLVLSHVKELLEQSRDTLLRIDGSLDVGVYSAGLRSRDTNNAIVVAGIQSVYQRAGELGRFDMVIIDECVPAGTLISTPNGGVAVENIHVGSNIFNATGVGVVEAISARMTEELIEMELSDGSRIKCTGNHPIFTRNGWTRAKDLEVGSSVFRREDVRVLRESVLPVHQTRCEWKNCQLHDRKTLEQATILLNLLLENNGECDAPSRCKGENDCLTREEMRISERARRERERKQNAKQHADATRGRMEQGICCDNNKAEADRYAEALQNRYCEQTKNDSDRNRWPITLQTHSTRCGQEEGCVFGSIRVVSIAHIKLDGQETVYNMQVSGHPSYYANGILTHNCHLIPPDGEGRYQAFIKDAKIVNPKVRIVGLTATPFRMTSGLICGPDNILNDICYEIGIKELILHGYLSPLISKSGITKFNTDSLHVRGGEYIQSEIEELMDDNAKTKAIVRELGQITKERKSILIFASSVAHAKHIVEQFQDIHGIEAGIVTGDTPSGERAELLARFKGQAITNGLFGDVKHPLQVMVNMNVLTTGFDATNIDCIVLLRPTLSAGLYVQMVGRGCRLHEGKKDTLVLDYGGNIMRHGPIDMVEVAAKKGGKGGVAPQKECPECRTIVFAGCTTCGYCGYVWPVPTPTDKLWNNPSEQDIISGKVTDVTYAVTDVFYSIHYKKNDKSATPTMKVQYYHDSNKPYPECETEWICLQHTGFAKDKAKKWWTERTYEPVPATIEQALVVAEAGLLLEPKKITVRTVSGEKFSRIVNYDFDIKADYDESGLENEIQIPEDEVPF